MEGVGLGARDGDGATHVVHNAFSQALPAAKQARQKDGNCKWEDESMAERERLGVPAQLSPWTGRPEVQLRGLMGTQREKEIIDLAWCRVCQ
jgi:hypothetical protein